MSTDPSPVFIRNTRIEDAPFIERISQRIYVHDLPWTPPYIASHLKHFPEGQLVAVERATGRVVGMAASLIISWEEYDHLDGYNDFTDAGWFTNHDPSGKTLYGAEVMVDPDFRRRGIGAQLYAARRRLVEDLGLKRIRAGARLPGYHQHAGTMSARAYVDRVVAGELHDPTLTFQLRQGFRVLALVPDYYTVDPKSREYAALIEWLNPRENVSVM